MTLLQQHVSFGFAADLFGKGGQISLMLRMYFSML
jgi:hypothetical protein